MLRHLLLSLTDPEQAGAGNPTDEPVTYTHADFMELSLAELEELTGVVRPKNSTVDEIDKYRERAWRSYQKDVTNLEEWGTARQGDDPDEMDRVNGNGNGDAAEELERDMLESAEGMDAIEDNYADDYIEDDRLH